MQPSRIRSNTTYVSCVVYPVPRPASFAKSTRGALDLVYLLEKRTRTLHDDKPIVHRTVAADRSVLRVCTMVDARTMVARSPTPCGVCARILYSPDSPCMAPRGRDGASAFRKLAPRLPRGCTRHLTPLLETWAQSHARHRSVVARMRRPACSMPPVYWTCSPAWAWPWA